jgi:arylsulfatase
MTESLFRAEALMFVDNGASFSGVLNMPKFLRLPPALLATALLVACTSVPETLPEAQPEPDNRPNFLVIVADDLGFSDLGLMGSEIRTPNLDTLAGEGLLLTNFHVAPTCSPTRAMLMTGVDTHPAGLGTMGGEASPEQESQPGYEGVLSNGVVTVATLLKDAGYHTYLAGKWHLGSAEGQLPTDRGFERSYGPARGGASHFSDQLPLFFPDSEHGTAVFVEDGEIVEQLPDDYFSTKDFTDKLIEHVEGGRADGKPFYAMATYTAPHWPLQAPKDYIDRYAGSYATGYDALRHQRVEMLKERGIISANTETPERAPWEAAWSSLTDDEKILAARRMELYAAMVENMDFHIGRLITYLKSNNGAEGNLVNRIVDDHDWVEQRFDNSLENMGRRGSYVFTGPGWAQASTAPFAFYKGFPTEGGIRTPAIVSGGVTTPLGYSDAFTSVKDVTPTILELAGVEQPGAQYQGRTVAPIEGESMVQLLQGRADQVHGDNYVMGWELFGRRALRRGDWKIVWLYEPYGDARWWLFDLAADPAETTDVSDQNPEIFTEMLAAWEKYATDNKVVLPAEDAGYGKEDPWD